MEVKSSPYLPKDNLLNTLTELKRRVAYKIWKNKLRKYGGLSINSEFKLLEIGCGPGYFLRCIEKWFPESEIYGLDIDESLIEFSVGRVTKTKLVTHDGHRLPFPDDFFDIVCSLQVIEHLEKPELMFAEAGRVLRSEGLLLISTPNPSGIPARILQHKWQGHRYDHVSLKIPQQWRTLVQNSGFQILEDGTTGLTGFNILQKFPFALINWIPMSMFGYFPWYKGESYMMIARKI